MKINSTIIASLLIIVLSFFFFNKINSRQDILVEYNNDILTFQKDLNSKQEIINTINYQIDSLSSVLLTISKEKRNVISNYQSMRESIEESNKRYMESIDQDGSGVPDNVEQGDYNGNGIPDFAE